ncbi:hypothetical protein V12B01_24049 [Vibrio splendidus 12B01]|nr:hypothetical protein V12B01_24049 [Vibrio splendidus 12B01]
MHRNTSESELRRWPQDIAVRRYELILAKLGVK